MLPSAPDPNGLPVTLVFPQHANNKESVCKWTKNNNAGQRQITKEEFPELENRTSGLYRLSNVEWGLDLCMSFGFSLVGALCVLGGGNMLSTRIHHLHPHFYFCIITVCGSPSLSTFCGSLFLVFLDLRNSTPPGGGVWNMDKVPTEANIAVECSLPPDPTDEHICFIFSGMMFRRARTTCVPL